MRVRAQDMMKSIIVAAVTIAICIGIVVACTYAIFTDKAVLQSHLEAGELDLKLERVLLSKRALNNAGELVDFEDDKRKIDFTEPTAENILGLDEGNIIVPGSHMSADLKLSNGGNVAFDYEVKLVVLGDDRGALNHLAEQLVFYYVCDGVRVEKTLAEIYSSGLVIAKGSMSTADSAKNFTVGLIFVDYDAGENPDEILGETNNKAQAQKIKFDIMIDAVQRTK